MSQEYLPGGLGLPIMPDNMECLCCGYTAAMSGPSMAHDRSPFTQSPAQPKSHLRIRLVTKSRQPSASFPLKTAAGLMATQRTGPRPATGGLSRSSTATMAATPPAWTWSYMPMFDPGLQLPYTFRMYRQQGCVAFM